MAIAVGILVITIRENKLREEVEKAEAANADTIEEKAMAEGVEAAGEIEAVGDTGEAKAFEEKQQTAKTESAKDMPKDVKRSMYLSLIHILRLAAWHPWVWNISSLASRPVRWQQES